ncbi:MAG TPA: substrate-binding domain-containing protein [Bacteroidia bacterium]|nr:substrate-binding domain-containing protein [Bacteroidia bacterium]
MSKIIYLSVCSLLLLLLCACNPYPNQKQYDDTTTSGNIKIACDQTFYNIIDGELDTFHALYKYAHIEPTYCSENEAFKSLLIDSSRIIIVSRMLNNEELEKFKSEKITPKQLHVATDAVAFIVNENNVDSVFTPTQLQQILSGEILDWNQISKQNKSGQMLLVFDDVYSSTARYAKEIINSGKEIKGNVFAVNKSEEVIAYVKSHPNAMGVVGVSYISDGDDPSTKTFLKNIKVVAVKNETDGTRYKPYQAYVAQGLYPYTRKVYIISREARTGLGTGFSSFVAGDVGQKIILKMGVLPASMPVRIVGFRDNN